MTLLVTLVAPFVGAPAGMQSQTIEQLSFRSPRFAPGFANNKLTASIQVATESKQRSGGVMNKKFLFAVVAYFVVTMATAYPWHILLFHEKYVVMGALTRGEPIMPFGMTAVVLQAVVFAWFYPLFYRHVGGGSPVIRGIQFGLFLGITVWSVMVFATAAKFAIEPVMDFVLLGTAFQFIQFTLVGAAIGLVYGDIASAGTE